MLPGNRDAYAVWCRCSGQLILGFAGAVDVNILAVKCLMDLEGLEDQAATLEKVQVLARIVLDEQHKRAKAASER